MPTYTWDELIDSTVNAVDCTGFRCAIKKPINYFEYCADIRTRKRLSVKKVIFNEPATIVFWGDGSKTVVKCAKGDKFNRYNGFCAALAKRIYGTSRARKIVEEGENQLVKDICKKGRKGKCRNK